MVNAARCWLKTSALNLRLFGNVTE